MLQRYLPAVLQQRGPAAAALHLQAAQVLQASNGRSSGAIEQCWAHSLHCVRHIYLKPGVVDMRDRPRRSKQAYFNPSDGPEAYYYWRDMWATQQKPPKQRRIPSRLPVYLEPEEQQQLIAAAVEAGIPEQLAVGPRGRRQVPRLIAALQAAGGAIPTQPEALAARIRSLLDLERQVPGLDLGRVFRTAGFSILQQRPQDVQYRLQYISKQLAAAGVSAAAAEPGLLLTAAPKPAQYYPMGIVSRAQSLPEVYRSCLGIDPPPGLLQQPFTAAIFLNSSHRKLQQHMQASVARFGQQAAASLYSAMPGLLLQPHSLISHKISTLAAGLQLSPDAAQKLVLREPKLLSHSAGVLQKRLKQLKRLLHLETPRQLQLLVCHKPALLHKRPETLAGKLALIQASLDLPDAAAAAEVAAAHPSLLSHSAECLQTAAAQFGAISASSPLAGLQGRGAQVLAAEPMLLTYGTSSSSAPERTLAGRLQMLESLAQQLGEPWTEQLKHWARSNADDVARTLQHRELADRVRWLLQAASPTAATEAVTTHGLATVLAGLSVADFDAGCCPGYQAEWEQRRAARQQQAIRQQEDQREQ